MNNFVQTLIGLASGTLILVLLKAANLFSDPEKSTATRDDWKLICGNCECERTYQTQLFCEAVSAGILAEDEENIITFNCS